MEGINYTNWINFLEDFLIAFCFERDFSENIGPLMVWDVEILGFLPGIVKEKDNVRLWKSLIPKKQMDRRSSQAVRTGTSPSLCNRKSPSHYWIFISALIYQTLYKLQQSLIYENTLGMENTVCSEHEWSHGEDTTKSVFEIFSMRSWCLCKLWRILQNKGRMESRGGRKVHFSEYFSLDCYNYPPIMLSQINLPVL